MGDAERSNKEPDDSLSLEMGSRESSWAHQEGPYYTVEALLEELDEMIPPSLKEE